MLLISEYSWYLLLIDLVFPLYTYTVNYILIIFIVLANNRGLWFALIMNYFSESTIPIRMVVHRFEIFRRQRAYFVYSSKNKYSQRLKSLLIQLYLSEPMTSQTYNFLLLSYKILNKHCKFTTILCAFIIKSPILYTATQTKGPR